MHKPYTVLKNEKHKILSYFFISTDHTFLARRRQLALINKEKITCYLRKSENINNFLDLAREMKKVWSMKVTVIPIVSCVLRMVIKDLKRRLEDLKIRERIESKQIN